MASVISPLLNETVVTGGGSRGSLHLAPLNGANAFDTVKGRKVGQPLRLSVGVVDVVPKLVVRSHLQPALALTEPVRLVCYEGPYE